MDIKKAEGEFSHIEAGWVQRFNAWGARFHLHVWFPHIPLALAVFVLGVLHISRTPIHEIGWALFSRDLRTVADGSSQVQQCQGGRSFRETQPCLQSNKLILNSGGASARPFEGGA